MAGERDETITGSFLRLHVDLYDSASRHPFTLSIRDGTVDLECFKRWLGQDYVFVRAFVRFVASVLVKLTKDADEADVDIVLGGMSALDQEIAWFKEEGSKWGLQLSSVVPEAANENYCRFLDELLEKELAVTLTALWAIEVVYNDSFAVCLEAGAKTPTELQGACERWGNHAFKNYCTALQNLADKYLLKAPPQTRKEAERVFQDVLGNEVHFWNMSASSPK